MILLSLWISEISASSDLIVMNSNDRHNRVLVTGGAGFIGSHLVGRLLRVGADVVVVDDLSTGSRSNLEHAVEKSDCKGELKFMEGRVSSILDLLQPGEFNRIYHLAAAVGVRLVIEKPIETIRTNIEETLALLEFATGSLTPTLIASTSEVYGKSTNSAFYEDDDVQFGPTIYSRWSYACSKAIDEYLALAFGKQRGLPVVIARFFNTVGPRQVGTYGMVLPRFVEAAIAGIALQVHGDGTQTRCFCDVRDVVPALEKLLENPSCHGRVFNIGSDTEISIHDLAELVIRTLGSRSSIELLPYEDAFADGFDDLQTRRPDLRRVREAIDFKPVIPLTKTIRDLGDLSSCGGSQLATGEVN